MKRKKINKQGISYLLIFITSFLLIVHDAYKLTLEPIFTGKLIGLTWFGVITLFTSLITLYISYEHLKKYAYRNALK